MRTYNLFLLCVVLLLSPLNGVGLRERLAADSELEVEAQAEGQVHTWWGKQDYIDHIWGCFARGDRAGASHYHYKTGWNTAVDECMQAEYCR